MIAWLKHRTTWLIGGLVAAVASFAQGDPEPVTFTMPDTSGLTSALQTGASSFVSSFVELLAANLPIVVGVGVLALVIGWVYRSTIGRLLSGGLFGGGKR